MRTFCIFFIYFAHKFLHLSIHREMYDKSTPYNRVIHGFIIGFSMDFCID